MPRRKDPSRPGLVAPVLRLAAAAALGRAAAGPLAGPDEAVRKTLAGTRSRTLDTSLPVMTDLGSTYAVAGLGLALWAAGRRELAKDVTGAGLLAWAVAQAAKKAYARPRPYDAGEVSILVRRPAGTSYPSGHPAVAAAIAAVLAPEVHQPLRGAVERMPWLVAFSRVYVGVHYPTDVVGGRLVGGAVADLWRRARRRR